MRVEQDIMHSPRSYAYRLGIFFLAAVATLALAQPPSYADQPKSVTYILAGRLFEGSGDQARSNVVIVVAGERIQAVSAAAEIKIPAGANVIDLSHSTVLPGL